MYLDSFTRLHCLVVTLEFFLLSLAWCVKRDIIFLPLGCLWSLDLKFLMGTYRNMLTTFRQCSNHSVNINTKGFFMLCSRVYSTVAVHVIDMF